MNPRMPGYRLDAVLRGFLRSYGLEDALRHSQTVALWPNLVGKQLSRVSQAERLQDGILVVRVSSGAWAQQLSLNQRELLRRYEEQLGRGIVKGFRFIVGTVKPAAAERVPEVGGAGPETDASTGSPSVPEEALFGETVWLEKRQKELEELPDEELRRVVARWIQTMSKRRRTALASGYYRCERCGAVTAGKQPLCPSCSVERQAVLHRRIREVLEDMPWLDARAVGKLVPGAEPEPVARVREELLEALREELEVAVAEYLAGYAEPGGVQTGSWGLKRLLFTATMLATGKRPEEVSRSVVFQALGPQAAAAWGRLVEGESQ